VGAWALFLLWPVLDTGWISDDMYNASLPGLRIYTGRSLAADAFHESPAGFGAAGSTR